MTAPGQEPDEVTTGKPGGKGPHEPDLGSIGDAHMPEDVREAVREEAAAEEAAPDEHAAEKDDAPEED